MNPDARPSLAEAAYGCYGTPPLIQRGFPGAGTTFSPMKVPPLTYILASLTDREGVGFFEEC